MKKLLVMAVAMLATIAASAQVYVGGSFGLSRNTSEDVSHFIIAPEVGYNLSEKWAVGGTIDFDYTKDGEVKSTVFSLAPYARYTCFTAVDNRLRLFVDGGFGIGFGKSKAGGQSSDTVTAFSIGFKPGVSFALSDNFSIVAHMGFLGYEGGNDAAKQAGIDETFGLNLSSMNLSFGFYYSF